MRVLARLFLLMQVFYLSFKFFTETANCATVFGLYFKIAPLLINSHSLPCGLLANMCRLLRKAVELCTCSVRSEKMWKPNWFRRRDTGNFSVIGIDVYVPVS